MKKKLKQVKEYQYKRTAKLLGKKCVEDEYKEMYSEIKEKHEFGNDFTDAIDGCVKDGGTFFVSLNPINDSSTLCRAVSSKGNIKWLKKVKCRTRWLI